MRGGWWSEGISPAHEKQREKRRLLEAKSFGEFSEKWFKRGADGRQHAGHATRRSTTATWRQPSGPAS